MHPMLRMEKKGKIGDLNYYIIQPDSNEDVYHVRLSDRCLSWTPVRNASLMAVRAFLEGLQIGKEENIVKSEKRGCVFWQYGPRPI